MNNDQIAMDAEEDEFVDDDNNEDNDRISVHYEQVRVSKVPQHRKTDAQVTG